MARHKEFDRDEVLDLALEAFWEQGYESTSLQMLVERMGIGRASLYDTFGCKDQLFREVMDRYGVRLDTQFLKPLRASGPPLDVLRDFFDAIVDSLGPRDARCCLLVKCSVTPVRDDPATRKQLRAFMRSTEKELCQLIERAQEQGDLPACRDAAGLAACLLTLIHGLNVRAGLGCGRSELRSVVHAGLRLLD